MSSSYSIDRDKRKFVEPAFNEEDMKQMVDRRGYCLVQPTHHNQIPVLITACVLTIDKMILRCTNLYGIHFSVTYKGLTEQMGNFLSVYDYPKEVLKYYKEVLMPKISELEVTMNIID